MHGTFLAFGMPGTWELLVIAMVALLLFGRRLPDVARSLGKSIVEFKKGMHDVQDTLNDQARLEPPRKQPAPLKSPSDVEEHTHP